VKEDRLRWWEDIPLALALVAQSYVVGLWYYASINGAAWQVDLAVAIGAGLALDLIVVTTVMGRRQGRSSGWSWATSLGAFACSSLIALDRYGWEYRSLLHVAFPLVVFLYSQHLATPRKRLDIVSPQTAQIALEALPERSRLSGAANADNGAAEQVSAQNQAPPDAPITLPLATNGTSAYECPHCQAPLKSKQARGAAVANGYCPACKPERLALQRN